MLTDGDKDRLKKNIGGDDGCLPWIIVLFILFQLMTR